MIPFQQGYVLLAPVFSPVSRAWDSWTPDLLAKSEKKAFRSSVFSMSCVTMAPAPFSSQYTFLVFLLLLTWLQMPFLLHLTYLTSLNSSWVWLSELHLCMLEQCLYFPPRLPVLSSVFVCFLFMFEFARNCFLYSYRPPGIFAWFPAWLN